MNKVDKRICPELRPLVAQANAGEGRFAVRPEWLAPAMPPQCQEEAARESERPQDTYVSDNYPPMKVTYIAPEGTLSEKDRKAIQQSWSERWVENTSGELHLDDEVYKPGDVRMVEYSTQEAFEHWLQEEMKEGGELAGCIVTVGAAKLFTEFGMLLAFNAGNTQAVEKNKYNSEISEKARLLDEPPAATFAKLMDKFERMIKLQEAARIKIAPHPTRERLLEALRWALGEDASHAPPIDASFFADIQMFRARLRRLSGL